MKILIVNSLYPPLGGGGAERSVAELADGLAKAGHIVRVLSLNSTRSPLPAKQDIGDVQTYRVSCRNFGTIHELSSSAVLRFAWHVLDMRNPLMSRAIRAHIADFQPEIFHTNNLAGFSTSAWIEAAKFRIPIVHTIRDYYLMCPRTTMFKDERNCEAACSLCAGLSKPKLKASNLVAGVVGISRSILNRHIQSGIFPKAKERAVIYNAPQLDPMKVVAGITNSRSETRVVIGYLGKLDRQKGIELLLENASRLDPSRFLLRVGGSGDLDYESELRSRYGRSPIEFLGRVVPEAFLANIDALVVPSLWDEPMGRVVLEAASLDVPVIASNRGALPELIEKIKRGCVFDPDKENDLLRRLESLTTRDQRSSDVRLPEFASKMVEEYGDVYLRVATASK